MHRPPCLLTFILTFDINSKQKVSVHAFIKGTRLTWQIGNQMFTVRRDLHRSMYVKGSSIAEKCPEQSKADTIGKYSRQMPLKHNQSIIMIIRKSNIGARRSCIHNRNKEFGTTKHAPNPEQDRQREREKGGRSYQLKADDVCVHLSSCQCLSLCPGLRL